MSKEKEINNQEAAEFKLLNEKVAQRETINAKKANARFIAYTVKSVLTVAAFCVISQAVSWAGKAGMIHPDIATPVYMTSLCAACLRFGVWFGRVVQK